MAQWTLDSSVSIVCEVAFTTGPLDTPSWTDVSAYLDKEWQSFRGKESEDDDIQPGYFTVYLDNSARTFDPEHAAGPYFGNLKPMKKIRLRVAVGAFSATIITGYVLSWPQDWGTFKSVAAVQCVDGSRLDGILPQSAVTKEILADNPKAYYVFRDGSLESELPGGPTLTDATSGVLFAGDPSVSQTLNLGIPLGDDSFLAIPDNNSGGYVYETPFGTSPFTDDIQAMEAWIYDAQNLIVTAAFATNSYMKWIFSSSGWAIEYRDQSTGGAAIRSWNSGNQGPPVKVVNGQHVSHVALVRVADTLVVIVNGTVAETVNLVVGGVGSTALAGIFVQSVPTQPPPSFTRWTTPAIAHLAIYQTAPSVSRIQQHWRAGSTAWADEYGGARMNRALDDVGWPSADRDIQPGGTRQAPYYPEGRTAMSYIRDVEMSEHPGVVFFARDGKLTFRDRNWLWTRTPAVTFNDNGTGITYTASNPRGNDVSTIRNVVTVSYARVGAITNRDQTSIDDYGEQPIDGELLEAPTMASAQDASNLGRFRTRTRGQPGTIIPQLKSDMVPNPGTQIPAVLGLELGDVVAFQRTPMSVGSAIVKKFLVLGIGHEVDAYQWTVTLYLSPPILAAADAPYLTLGDATRGKVGVAFGNIIPF